MKLKLLVITALFICICLSPSVSAAYYGNYTNMTFNITPSMGAQTAYQMKFILSNSSGVSGYYAPDNVVYTNGTTRPDWADVAFFDTNGISKPFWIENNTQTTNNATAWVLPDSIAVDNSSKGSWEFGNASQTASTMNGLNTFPLFFDDCNSINTTQVAVTGTTASGGVCVVAVGSSSNGIATVSSSFPENTTLRSRYQFYHNANDFTTHGYYTATKYAKFDWGVVNALAWSYINKDSAGVSQTYTDSDVYKIREIKRNGTASLIFSVAGLSDYVRTTQVPTGNMGIQFVQNTASGVNPINIDWFVIRKSVAIEPITSGYSSTMTGGGSAPVASFTSNVTSGSVPFTVQFNDTSSSAPTSWVWVFGDGGFSAVQNATHTYQTTGLYNVTLLSKNAFGSSISASTTIWATNTVSGYNYHQQFNVNSTESKTWYQVPLDVYSGSGTSTGKSLFLNNHASNFPYDIRFNETGSTLELPHWVETPLVNSTYARVWINARTINSSIVCSYGKSADTDSSSGFTTFLTFDDFNRTTYTPTATGYTVSANASRYEGWPGITKMSDGTLIAIYRTVENNTHDYDPSGRVVIRKSTDSGVTWGSEIVVSDVANIDERNANIADVTIGGTETLLAVYDVYYSLGTPQWPKSRMSTDGGNTWSSEVNATTALVTVGTYGRPIQLSNGKILAPFYYPTGTYDMYIEETSDGLTWADYVATGSASAKTTESSIIETMTNGMYQGGVLMLARTETSPYTIYQSTSTDYGHTWSAFTATNLPNPTTDTPPDLYRLPNGNILMEYSINNAAVGYESIDEGVTWSKYTDIATPAVAARYYDHAITINSTYVGTIYNTNYVSSSDIYFVQSPYPLSVSSYWRQNGTPTMTISSGELDYTQTVANQYIRSGNSYGLNYSIMSRNKIKALSSGVGMTEWGFGFRSSPTLTDYAGLTADSYTVAPLGRTQLITSTTSANTGSSSVTLDTAYRQHEITRNSTANSIWYINGTNVGSSASNFPTAALPATIGASYASGTATEESVFDWIAVRKYSFPEPSIFGWVGEGTATPTLIANFTVASNPSTVNDAVIFTDASNGLPTTWNWTIDGSITNTTQNAAYIFSIAGTHTIDLNVTNSTGSFSNITKTQTVVNASGFSQVDLWQTGHYTKTLHITDSATNAPIPVVVVTDSNGQSYTTTNGTAYFTEDAGAVVFYFAATGYVSKSMSYIIDGDSTDTVQMVAAGTSTPPSIVYIPQQVRFQLVGTDGFYLSNVFIQATPINFTAPANWTETLLGISPNVGIRDTTVYGTTGTDGSWVAPMLQSFEYQVNMTRGTDVNYNFTIYPTSLDYKFTIPVAGYLPIATPSNIVSYSLQNATINETTTEMYQFINMTYNDGSLNTDKLSFVVYDVNSTLIYSQNYTGAAANSQNFSYVQRCGKGQAYTYGFQANQSAYGWINQSSTFQLTSQIELLQNGPAWVGQWVAIVLIVVFGTIFMIYSKPFALIGIPLLTWSFQYVFKLIPGSFLSLIGLGCMLTIGVLVYIRQAENKIQ